MQWPNRSQKAHYLSCPPPPPNLCLQDSTQVIHSVPRYEMLAPDRLGSRDIATWSITTEKAKERWKVDVWPLWIAFKQWEGAQWGLIIYSPMFSQSALLTSFSLCVTFHKNPPVSSTAPPRRDNLILVRSHICTTVPPHYICVHLEGYRMTKPKLRSIGSSWPVQVLS